MHSTNLRGRPASNRWSLIGIGFLCWTLFAAGLRAESPATANVVVLLADQWRAQAFGFAADPNVRTPNFDRLARESVHFRHAVAGIPVCSPTRASLLTGQRPLTHGIFLNDVPLSTNAVTLAKVLRQAGWQTGAIGKWHLDGQGRSAFIPPERRQGFDYWKVQECTHDYTNSTYYSDSPTPRRWEGYDALSQTKDATAYIRTQAQSGQRFFLWLAWGPPHDPYHTAPERFRALYDPARLILRSNVPPAFEQATRKSLAGYYAHCSALDEALGELLSTLESTGQSTNTLFLFTSDHGDMLGSHGLWKKQKPFDESARVPFLLRWPAGLGASARTVDAPINSEDVMPTLLGLLRLPRPPSVEGLDFSDHLRGGPAPGDGAALLACLSPFGEFERRTGGKEYRGIRTARFTYVRDLHGPWLLFDHQADPYQLNNGVGQASWATVQADLEQRLQEKLAAQQDTFRTGPEYIRQWSYRVNQHGTVPYQP
ncbi:MAG: sulfatase [Verrucomicrobia bacterium]|nr:sulfatase [Verrucomicrobiota bacterium]